MQRLDWRPSRVGVFMRKSCALSALAILAGVVSAVAAVGTGYSLFGQASYISPGNSSNRAVKLVSNGNANPAVYSGIDFAVPANVTINNLNTLSTDYDFTASTCGVWPAPGS